MTFSLFSVALIFILATAILGGAVRGIKRGFIKTLLSLVAAFTSLVIALIISPYISTLFGELVLDFVKLQPFYGTTIPQSAYMDIFITALASMAISAVLFLVVFAVLKLWFGAIFSLIYRSYKENKKPFPDEDAPAYERRPKVWGGAAGAVSGLLTAVIILSPLMGVLGIANTVIDIVDRADRAFFANENAKKQVDALRTVANDGVGTVIYNMGGNLIFSSAASTTVNSSTIYAVNEVETIELLVGDFLALYPILQNPAAVTEEHAETIETLCVHLEDTKMLDILMAEYLPRAAGAWLRGEAFMKINKPAMNELIMPAFDGILEICASSDVYTVKANTTSLLRIYSLIITSGILQTGNDFNAIIDCIQRTDLIAKLEAEIDRNPNMSIIKTYTAEIAMRALADQIYSGSIGDIVNENYELLTEKLADAIETINNKAYGTNEERIAAMTSYAQEYLSDYGISVPPSLAEPIAEVMLSKVGSGSGISASDIQNFLKGYLPN